MMITPGASRLGSTSTNKFIVDANVVPKRERKPIGSVMQMSASRTTNPIGDFGLSSSINLMQAAPRSSLLTMNAAATQEAVKIEGESSTDAKDGWADFYFYAQKYDKEKDEATTFKYKEELMKNAKYLATPGRGILASDESNMTCGKRLEDIGLVNSEELRRKWRECLYSTPDLGQYVSGVIMYDETAR